MQNNKNLGFLAVRGALTTAQARRQKSKPTRIKLVIIERFKEIIKVRNGNSP